MGKEHGVGTNMGMNNWLPEAVFVEAVKVLPLGSVDLVVVNSLGQMLLGLRRNAPAKNWWFTPGGRVRKNESSGHCLRRIAQTELGLIGEEAQSAQLMGVWDHFYEDSAYSTEISTHYVNLPHCLRLSRPLHVDTLPTDQHTAWRWQDPRSAALADDVHPYVQAYAQAVACTNLVSG